MATDLIRDDLDGVRSYLRHCERSVGQYLFGALLRAGAESASRSTASTFPPRPRADPALALAATSRPAADMLSFWLRHPRGQRPVPILAAKPQLSLDVTTDYLTKEQKHENVPGPGGGDHRRRRRGWPDCVRRDRAEFLHGRGSSGLKWLGRGFTLRIRVADVVRASRWISAFRDANDFGDTRALRSC